MSSRSTFLVVVATTLLSGLVTQVAAQSIIPCEGPKLRAQRQSQSAALALLGSVTQLGSKIGAPVLTSNLATTVAINNLATPRQRARALIDAQITAINANTLADGLGRTMGAIYRRSALFKSHDDGATITCGEIAPSVTALIDAAEQTPGADSNAGKFAFADGGKGRVYTPPPGGTVDAIGTFYGAKKDAPGGDKYGDPRPFQTASIDATAGPRIQTFSGKDFFGVETNSRAMLVGANAADMAAGRTGQDLVNNPSYPSGHTTFGYTESLLLALMVPERFRAMVYRGSEYGDSRIVIGAHYAIDVIAGRTLATYDIAQALAGKADYGEMPAGTFQDGLAAAARDLRDKLQTGGCPSIATCALDPIVRAGNATVMVAGVPKPASVQAAYVFRLHYGLAPMASEADPPEIMPVAAGFLLQTRFPYLTPEQRSDVLRTTEGPSGHFLDVNPIDGSFLFRTAHGPEAQAGAYSRINLFAAGGGYASFSDRVVVNQDAAAIKDPHLQPFADFARADTWSNDIKGLGGLTKRGTGTLTLAGTNAYGGPTLVEGGTLEIAGSVTSPTSVEAKGTLAGTGHLGEVFILQNGALAPGAVGIGGTMTIGGSLALARGSKLILVAAKDGTLLRIDGRAILDETALVLKAPVKAGQHITLLKAKEGVVGKFSSVTLDDPELTAEIAYEKNAVILTVKAKSAAL